MLASELIKQILDIIKEEGDKEIKISVNTYAFDIISIKEGYETIYLEKEKRLTTN